MKIDLKTRWGELEEGQRLQSGSSWTLSIGLAVEVAEGEELGYHALQRTESRATCMQWQGQGDSSIL